MKATAYSMFLLQSALSLPHHPSQATTLIVPRQAGSGVFAMDCHSTLVGKERTVYRHQQVSQTNDCSSAENCGVNHVESETFGWEVSAGPTIDNFLSVGVAVQKSTTMGNEYNCGETTSKRVCVWGSVKYLEYDVQRPDQCQKNAPITTIQAPAKDTNENHYYCQTDDNCKGINEKYFNDQTADSKETEIKEKEIKAKESKEKAPKGEGPKVKASKESDAKEKALHNTIDAVKKAIVLAKAKQIQHQKAAKDGGH